jgi:predicted amidohydrolase
MKAGFLQFEPAYLDVIQNLAAVTRFLHGVDADLLVLPELFATGYNFASVDDLATVAEDRADPNAPTLVALKEWSMATGATIVAGYAEREKGSFFNSAAVVSAGAIVGNYRKVHLFYKEKTLFEPGHEFLVVEQTDRDENRYRLGVMICFDWYFPEAARSLALSGADVIGHPSNLVRRDCPRSMPIRALENHVFTITANRVGTEVANGEALTFIGQSRACDPEGNVVAESGREEVGLVLFEIDPCIARDRQITPTNHLFDDRRPEVYTTTTPAPL